MSNLNLKAKNKNTGEIVEFNKYDDYEKGKGYLYQEPSGLHFNRNSIYNEQEFNTLYEPIPQTDLGVDTDTSKKEDIIKLSPCCNQEIDKFGNCFACERYVEVETWEDRLCEQFDDEIGYQTRDSIIKFFQQELERIKTNFMTEFTDQDTRLLNISKYDHERIINFINNEIK